jgi:hypothetical protein
MSCCTGPILRSGAAQTLLTSFSTAVEQYSMGSSRKLADYLKIVGLNMNTKEVTYTAWCETGVPPPGFEKYVHLYEV